jgi:hypothetical protein
MAVPAVLRRGDCSAKIGSGTPGIAGFGLSVVQQGFTAAESNTALPPWCPVRDWLRPSVDPYRRECASTVDNRVATALTDIARVRP